MLVTVYGNRAYEDALKELYDIAVDGKFIPVAGGAFVAEHSYSSKAYSIAPNRPDEDDIKKAQEFGSAIRKKLQKVQTEKILPRLWSLRTTVAKYSVNIARFCRKRFWRSWSNASLLVLA